MIKKANVNLSQLLIIILVDKEYISTAEYIKLVNGALCLFLSAIEKY